MTSRSEGGIGKSAGLPAGLAVVNLLLSYWFAIYAASVSHDATVFEDIVLTTLVFIALCALEFGFVLSWLGSKRVGESSLWELRSGTDRELANIRTYFAEVTELACDDDSGPVGQGSSEVAFPINKDSTYLILVGHRNAGAGGSLRLVVVPEPSRGWLALAALASLSALSFGRQRSHSTRRR